MIGWILGGALVVAICGWVYDEIKHPQPPDDDPPLRGGGAGAGP